MEDFLATEGIYYAWGLSHFLWLLSGGVVCFLLIRFAKSKSNALQERIGLYWSMVPMVVWLALTLVAVYYGQEDYELILPFHICYFLNFVFPFVLFKRSYVTFELLYGLVAAGCLQALLTPDLQTEFPNLYHIRFFVVHLGLIISLLYCLVVFEFRPTWKSLGKCFLATNIYGLCMFGVNSILGTNFMFTHSKPTSASLLDSFGDWPMYILGAELIAIFLFVLVLLPFLFLKKRKG